MVKRGILICATFFLIAILGIIALMNFSGVPVSAASTNSTPTSATVTINQFITVTLTNTPVTFGTMDPGAAQNATNNPLTVTIGSETNVDFDIAVKADNANFVSGSNTFAVSNLKWDNDLVGLGTDYTTSDANVYTGETTPGAFNIYHQLFVPSPQKAGAYSVPITVTASAV